MGASPRKESCSAAKQSRLKINGRWQTTSFLSAFEVPALSFISAANINKKIDWQPMKEMKERDNQEHDSFSLVPSGAKLS